MRKQKTKELVNTEWVERIAVNRLESALLSTGLVVPTIPTGDKAPSWDGEISLYSSQTSFPKRKLVGRIPAQVKGPHVRSYSTPYGDRIINLTLELLKLYDQSKNLKILDVCLQLLSFVGEHRDTPKELIAINRLQIEKRRRVLSTEEKEYLLTLKRPEVILPYQFAASILLESFQEADLIYERMNENERKLFDGFPIENLWRNSDYRS